MIESKIEVKLKDVLKAYWKGIKYYPKTFHLSIWMYILSAILGLLPALGYKRFFDVISTSSAPAADAPLLVKLLLIIAFIKLIEWLTYRVGHLAINYFDANVMAKLRANAFDYLIDHSYSFFSNTFTGSLIQKVNRFARSFEKLYDNLVYNFLPLLISTVGTIYIVWTEQPKISYIILIWAVIIMVLSYFFSVWKLKYDVKAAAADSKSSAYLSDVITNQNTVASFSASSFESIGYKKVLDEQAKASKLTWDLDSLSLSVQSASVLIIEFLVFYYAIQFWGEGLITIGTFVLIQVYILSLTNKLWGFSNIIRSLYESIADAKEMVEILQKPHGVEDRPGARSLKINNGSIIFKDVSFDFNDERGIIENLNLHIKSGEKVALIGPSGAGKSTIVKLILRMYDVKQGSITIDSEDIREVTQNSLRKNISLVPQDPLLFHRTLMENIRYGRLDATDNEVIKAAQLAHCDEFIEGLPNKYDTFVGERGIKLSGGERQRVAIARAILKNAPILILDEATSSLDSHSESLIQDALNNLMKGKTTIVIAHRLSTIRKMDRIIVLQKGSVLEEGSHEELINKDESLYKNLWNLQAGGFILS